MEMEALFKKFSDFRLYEAAAAGHVEEVRRIANENKEMVNSIQHGGLAPIHAAATNGHEEVIRELIRCGASVNSPTATTGDTALHMVMKERIEVMQTLLELGADVHAHNNVGRTPLFAALWEGERKHVEMLVKAGSDVNERDNDGVSPIHGAFSAKVFKILIDAGADLRDVTDTEGNSIPPSLLSDVR